MENQRNFGFGGGLNVGIKEAIKRNAEYVLCLNNDVVVDNRILTELVIVGGLSPKIGGLCPMEYFYDQPDRIQCAGGVNNCINGKVFGCGELDNGQYDIIRETGLLSGPAMMLKVNTLLDIGFFDENFFYGPEDSDIALRAIRGGYRLMFVPKAKLWHKRRGATGGKVTPLNVYFQVRNRILFLKKHARKLEFIVSILRFAILEFPITILNCFFHNNKRGIDAAIKGVIWNLNRDLIPSDIQMVKLLTVGD